ncbi:MAG TPA: amidohydrolase family protein [Alphaproteobacteria bacterium]|nr:amidohydrolase family protein [Alphaproteobacteria bacterium]
MAHEADLVIRGGLIADGSGGEPFLGDVAVSGGNIVAVGPNLAVRGTEEIDAAGHVVTPGFIDIHTHYDGQVTWENRLRPTSGHGVTTTVMGNCGIGFAPCKPEDRQRLMRLMEGVEDLPEPVLAAGLPWNWTSFPEYLDSLSARQYDIDFAAQLPHSALRVYAMGERGVDREAATADDIALMARLAGEAVEAGALGFSTSRTINHRASDGRHVPTLTAAEEELTGIALGLTRAGKGVLQLVSDFEDLPTELPMLRRIVEASGRPLSIAVGQWHHAPDRWRTILDWVADVNRDGLKVAAQVPGRPIGLLLGFELSMSPFMYCPSYKALAGLPIPERLAALRNPELKAKIIAEAGEPTDFPAAPLVNNFDNIFAMGNPPNYEPKPEAMVGARARAMGVPPRELAYDLMLEDGGRAVLIQFVMNYVERNLDVTLKMLNDQHTVLGLSDGGAHLGYLCDASLPTFMLTHWVRDRAEGGKLTLGEAVKALTVDTARVVGLLDRGRIAPGYKADINIIDWDRLTLKPPTVAYDLPSGGRRLTQDAAGYVATIVNGITVYRDGRPTGAFPGRLVRGQQAAPAA